jgi:hypothetical protein
MLTPRVRPWFPKVGLTRVGELKIISARLVVTTPEGK